MGNFESSCKNCENSLLHLDFKHREPSFTLYDTINLMETNTMEELLAILEAIRIDELCNESSNILNEVQTKLKNPSHKAPLLTGKFKMVNRFLQTLLCLASKLTKIYNTTKAEFQQQNEFEMKYEVTQLNSEVQRLQPCFTKLSQISQLKEQLSEECRMKKELEKRIEREMEVASQLKRNAQQDLELHKQEKLKQVEEIEQLESMLEDEKKNMEHNQREEQKVTRFSDMVKLRGLFKEWRAMKQLVDEKDQQNQQLNSKKQKLTSEKTELKGKLKQLNKENKQCYTSSGRLQQDCCTEMSQISQLKEQLAEECRMKKQLEERIKREMKVISQLRRDIKEEIERHKQEKSKQAKKIRHLKLRLQLCCINVEDYQIQEQMVLEFYDMCSFKEHFHRLYQVELLVSKKDKENQQLQREVETLMSEVTETKKKIQQTIKEKEKKYASNEVLYQEGYAKDEQLFEFNKQLVKVNQMKEELERKIAGETEHNNQLQRSITDQELQMHQLPENVENLKQNRGKRIDSKDVEELQRQKVTIIISLKHSKIDMVISVKHLI